MFRALQISFTELGSQFVFSRLFREDEAVEGNCWFAKCREDGMHVFANSLRVFIVIFFSPIYFFLPRTVLDGVSNFFKASWETEYACTPDAVLNAAPGGGQAKYEVSHLNPKWMVKITIRGGKAGHVRVPWSEEIDYAGYTSLSYPFDSAIELFKEDGNELPPPPPQNLNSPSTKQARFSNPDRQRIALAFLSRYMHSRAAFGPDRVEYVWLDEFCLSDPQASPKDAAAQRTWEVGRLADIFRRGLQVCVFCHIPDCDHTAIDCPWANRLFTLAEILHAEQVIRMTRTVGSAGYVYNFYPEAGRTFREKIQANAGLAKRWHLYAIMQHSSNSGAVSWQSAIHALIVESILRDEAGGFHHHEMLGKALNGLLPRRARLSDLPGEDGFADLAWLLELNQGFYNSASLAAVCSLGETDVMGQCWLGRPIAPSEGHERLEPLVTAFPIPFALNLINPTTIGLRQKLKRDVAGLYRNPQMRGLRLLGVVQVFVFFILGIIVESSGSEAGLFLMYLGFIIYAFIDLVGGSMYLVRTGWILLPNSHWEGRPRGPSLAGWLGHRDSNLRSLTSWGDTQLVPVWRRPSRRTYDATLVDLKHGVVVQTFVLDTQRANAVVALAVHGCGISCLLVHRPDDPALTAHKVGMVNMPPYVLAQGRVSGTLRVGAITESPENGSSSSDEKASFRELCLP